MNNPHKALIQRALAALEESRALVEMYAENYWGMGTADVIDAAAKAQLTEHKAVI